MGEEEGEVYFYQALSGRRFPAAVGSLTCPPLQPELLVSSARPTYTGSPMDEANIPDPVSCKGGHVKDSTAASKSRNQGEREEGRRYSLMTD